jgi:hypothetical protein
MLFCQVTMVVAKVLSAGLSPQRTMFNPRPVSLGFVVDEVAMGTGIFSESFSFSLSVSFHQNSITTYHRRYTKSAVNNFVR